MPPFIIFIAVITFIRRANSQNLQEIEVPYFNPSIETKNLTSTFQVSLPESYEYLKISTIPSDSSIPVNFHLSYTSPSSSFSDSNAKILQSGNNTLIIKRSPQKYKYVYLIVNVYSLDTKFSLNISSCDVPSIVPGEEVNFFLTEKIEFTVNYDQPEDIQDSTLFFYAIGANIGDITFNVFHLCKDKEEEVIEVKEMFYSGYGALLDIENKAIYKGQEGGCYFKLRLVPSSEAYSILGAKFVSNDPKNNFLDLKSMRDIINFVGGSSFNQCYTITNFPMKEEYYYLTITVFPSTYYTVYLYLDIDLEPLNTYGNEGELTSNTYTIYISPSTKYICIRRKSSQSFTYMMSIILPEDVEKKQIFVQPLFNGLQTSFITPPGKVNAFRRRRFVRNKNSVIFKIYTFSGNPRLYGYFCNDYPCEFDEKKLRETDKIKNIPLNPHIRGSSYFVHYYSLETSYYSKGKALALVHCEGNEDCHYLISVSIEEQIDIIRLENEVPYSRMINDQTEKQMFYYQNSNDTASSLSFVLENHSGKSKMTVTYEGTGVKSRRSYASNKEILTYTASFYQNDLTGNYIVVVNPIFGSYYSLYVLKNIKFNPFSIAGGIITAEVLRQSTNRIFAIRNMNRVINTPYVVTVTPYNCNVKPIIGLKTHGIINQTKTYVLLNGSDNSTVYLQLKNVDSRPDYECVVEISGSEMTRDYPLLLSDAMHYRNKFIEGTFTNHYYQYAYVPNFLVKSKIMLIIDLPVYAVLEVKVKMWNQTNIYSYEVKSNKTIVLSTENLECSTPICALLIEVECSSFPDDVTSFDYGINIQSFRYVPKYIRKETMESNEKTEYYSSDNGMSYYYTDINNVEFAAVYVIFKRGVGEVYVRLVAKERYEKDSNWNNHVELPYRQINSDYLFSFDRNYYASFLDSIDLEICAYGGCDLIIGIKNHYSFLSQSSFLNYNIMINTKEEEREKKFFNLGHNEYYHGSSYLRGCELLLLEHKCGNKLSVFHFLAKGGGEVYVAYGRDEKVSKIHHSWSLLSSGVLTFITDIKNTFLSIAVNSTLSYDLKYSCQEDIQNNTYYTEATEENGEICDFNRTEYSDKRCLVILPVKDYYESSYIVATVISLNDDSTSSYKIFAKPISENDYIMKSQTSKELINEFPDEKSASCSSDKDGLIFCLFKEYESSNFYVLFTIYGPQGTKGLFLPTTQTSLTNKLLYFSHYSLLYKTISSPENIELDIDDLEGYSSLTLKLIRGKAGINTADGLDVQLIKGDNIFDFPTKRNNFLKVTVSLQSNDTFILVYLEKDNKNNNGDKYLRLSYISTTQIMFGEKNIFFPQVYFFVYDGDRSTQKSVTLEIQFFNEVDVEIYYFWCDENYHKNVGKNHRIYPQRAPTAELLKLEMKALIQIEVPEDENKKYFYLHIKNNTRISEHLRYIISNYPNSFTGSSQTKQLSQGIYYNFQANELNNNQISLKLSAPPKKSETTYFRVEVAFLNETYSNFSMDLFKYPSYDNQNSLPTIKEITNLPGKTVVDIVSPYSDIVLKKTSSSNFVLKYNSSNTSFPPVEEQSFLKTLKAKLSENKEGKPLIEIDFDTATFISKEIEYYLYLYSVENSIINVCNRFLSPIFSEKIITEEPHVTKKVENIELPKQLGIFIKAFYRNGTEQNYFVYYTTINTKSSFLKKHLFIIISVALGVLLLIIIIIICKKRSKKKKGKKNLLLNKEVDEIFSASSITRKDILPLY